MQWKYILNGHVPVPEPDLMKWAKWFETADRIVAKTKVGNREVSTVFLALDHNFLCAGPPLFFETMIFPECAYCARCSTWEEAEAEHRKAVEMLLEEEG
jgi:hypothetical protein